MILQLILSIVLSPIASSYVAALAVGEPGLAVKLVRICRRESRCQPISIHTVDERKGWAAWRNAVRVGRLDPNRCIWHGRGSIGRWSTRGSWGTMAAYTVDYLADCYPPELLDVPIVGALAAARRLQGSRKRRGVTAVQRWAMRMPAAGI